MHYVTEDELREAFSRAPFTSYELPADARLTPSARQFLIDFHVDFDAHGMAGGGSRAVAGDAGAPAAGHLGGSALEALADDARVLGARLRLVGCHALGVDNAIARVLDSVGLAWQIGEDLGCAGVVGDPTKSEEAAAEPERVPLPEASPLVHPVYFEMAVAEAELRRSVRFWRGALREMGPEERAYAEGWVACARLVSSQLADALARVSEEVRHG